MYVGLRWPPGLIFEFAPDEEEAEFVAPEGHVSDEVIDVEDCDVLYANKMGFGPTKGGRNG